MRVTRKNVTALLASGALAAGLTGCAAGSPTPTGRPSTAAGGSASRPIPGTLTVFAAASLRATFVKIAADFEANNPGTRIIMNFAGSSDLVTQITQGAPADVFASADTQNMAKLADAKLIDATPTNFATNVLQIAVPPSNPASISSFADLAKPGVRVVVCASQVPCGSAAETIEKVTGTSLAPVSEETSVTDVLGKVTSGEADAGLVYVTDIKSAGDKATGIPFAESDQAVNTYPVAVVSTSTKKDLARAFIAAVTGSEGRQVLRDAGFGSP